MIRDTTSNAISDQAAEAHRQAYNAAFDELGLSWHWDAVTYATLPGQGAERVRAYLETEHAHLLRAYDADFLVQAIETAKERCHTVMLRRRSVTHTGRAASSYASYAAA